MKLKGLDSLIDRLQPLILSGQSARYNSKVLHLKKDSLNKDIEDSLDDV